MYMPYLRGRQAEQTAILNAAINHHKKFPELGHFSNKVKPIFEPVTLSGLEKFLIEAHNNKIEIVIIVNPEHGDFRQRFEILKPVLDKHCQYNKHTHFAYIINESSAINEVEDMIAIYPESMWTFIHKGRKNPVDINRIWDNLKKPGFNVIDQNLGQGYLGSYSQCVKLSDPFRKKTPNSQYADILCEFFSEDTETLQNPYIGYSDYSVIGEAVPTGGGAPKTIAIHLIYLKGKSLWVYHALSSVNQIRPNINVIIGEALEQVLHFVTVEHAKLRAVSEACRDMCILGEEGGTTNLTILKGYAIQHHLELVAGFSQIATPTI